MKRFILLPAAIVFIFFHTAFCQEAPPEVASAAEAGLQGFLQQIPQGDAADFGFSAGDTLQDAVLGAPFQLMAITPDAMAGYKGDTPVAAILTETGLWYFPVMLNGEPRTMLVVDRLDGVWQAVSLGNSNLARMLSAAGKRWPRSEAGSPLLIAVFQAKQYLLALPQVDAQGLVSLSPDFAEGGQPRQAGLEMERSDEVIKRLLPMVMDNIRSN